MPSVEYNENALIEEVESREYEDPETGEIVSREIEHPKKPFEVRIGKWLEREDGYHLFGFVEVTEFGQSLASQSEPWAWLADTYSVADGLTEQDVLEMINGVAAIENARLGAILSFGNVDPVSAGVTAEDGDRFDFEIVLDSSETFNIDWLTVDFDPSRGGN